MRVGRGTIGLTLIHLVFVGAIGLHVVVPFLLPDGARSDFGYFYRSAVEVAAGGSPYSVLPDPSSMGDGGDPVVNLNPPFQTALTVPLAHFDYGTAMWIWYLSSLAAGIAAGFVMAGAFASRRPLLLWGPLFAAILLLYPPSFANAWLAQLGLVLALVAAVTFLLLRDDRWTTAGAVLGAAAGLKIFVGLFAVFFLLTRRWRALVGFSLAFGGTLILGGLVVGWSAYPAWLELLTTVDWHAWSWNSSIFGSATRLFGSPRNAGLLWGAEGAGAGPLIARVAAVVLVVGYGWLVYRGDRTDTETLRVGMSLTFVAMLILSPLGWLYYLPCLIPSCVLLVRSSRDVRERVGAWASVAAFLLFATVLQRPYPGTDLLSPEYAWWKAEAPLLGMFALAGGHVMRLVGLRARDESIAESA